MLDLGMLLKCSIEIDPIVPNFTSALVGVVKILIPIVLIAYGMIDLAKAVMSNDDKVMKEAQNKLIHRIIYAVIIFFVVAIVQLIFGMLAGAGGKTNTYDKKDKNDITACINWFINGENTDGTEDGE